ncbi:hypothetical protein TRFO_30248 [Tritrichomonas foetus]|uniref:Condensin complex subunit 1 C-terminal domain-containing protein n=1 Tax=Tritrichomonas foetus TaxID=1144522 RepID=A0A1J4JZA4_9EUKA|nr:hypothetical protein TRFO_30248 [Tritrichomonas foetus]|eukprot:OHT02581.1 hypothetical protein TRFO_30248 [Tritrichomonas foetus]
MLEINNNDVPLLYRSIDEQRLFLDVCSPFSQFTFDSFDKNSLNLEFISKSLIPKATDKILLFDSNTLKSLPTFVKVIIDNFGKSGLEILNNSIFSALESLLIKTNLTKPSVIFDAYLQSIESISQNIRNEFLIETINQYSSNQEANLRIVATRLITLVTNDDEAVTNEGKKLPEDSQKQSQENIIICEVVKNNDNSFINKCRSKTNNIDRVKANFVALSLDRVPQVRASVISCLAGVKFNQSVIDSILRSSVHDNANSVQRAAATMIGAVAPHLVEPLKTFLSHRETAKAALKSVKNVVIKNNFECIYDAFQNAMKFQPENSCAVILNISRVIQKEEHRLLLECAMQLKGHLTLINYLFKFSDVFENKDIFLEFLDPNNAKKWRTRIALMKQTILFIPVFHERLITIAKCFSRDDVAIVRDCSVELWTRLILDNPNCFESLIEIIDDGFHQKIVVCKTIGKILYHKQNTTTNQPITNDSQSNTENSNLGNNQEKIQENNNSNESNSEFSNENNIENNIIYENENKVTVIAKKMSEDPVANVRLCMARNLVSVAPEIFHDLFGESKDPEIIALMEENAPKTFE